MVKLYPKISVVIGLCFILMAGRAWAAKIQISERNYQRLYEMIELEDLEAPLVPFSNQKSQFDHDLNRENLAYLNENQDVLSQIKDHFQSNSLNWKLANSYKRLLVVPENRADYAELFKTYCDDAVAYTLEATKLSNPLKLITTLQSPLPEIHHQHADSGVTAYLVHNIADEYIEEYQFFIPETDSRAIQVNLRNLEFSGHIGSYNSDIVIGENRDFKFIHNPYTLWQNSAKDPLNVLVVPVEETLHMALRTATEVAIQQSLKRSNPQTIDAVQDVVNEWMAVEEAIVGGLVAEIMPGILEQFLGGAMTAEMRQSLTDRHAHAQYRYLEEGIRLVTDLGLLPAIDLYKSQPHKFKQLLSSAPV